MPVAFGFSVGDFIAAVKLIDDVVDAVRESGRASASFAALVEELERFKLTLSRANEIQLDARLERQQREIHYAAEQCLTVIQEFWDKAQKYEEHLYQPQRRKKIRRAVTRIKWALVKQKDVDDLREVLQSHVTNYATLLLEVSLVAARVESLDRRSDHSAVLDALQAFAHQIMAQLTRIYLGVGTGVQLGQALVRSSMHVTSTLIRTFTRVDEIYGLLRSMPPQVL
jgi:hypothetical protein